LKCDSTRTETRFRLSAKRTSPFKSARASVQSTTGSRGVRISGSNAGYTMLRCSVKGTGYPLHSPVSPSLPLPASQCAIPFQLESTAAARKRITYTTYETSFLGLSITPLHHREHLYFIRISIRESTLRTCCYYDFSKMIPCCSETLCSTILSYNPFPSFRRYNSGRNFQRRYSRLLPHPPCLSGS
jgi:hypothetical protein